MPLLRFYFRLSALSYFTMNWKDLKRFLFHSFQFFVITSIFSFPNFSFAFFYNELKGFETLSLPFLSILCNNFHFQLSQFRLCLTPNRLSARIKAESWKLKAKKLLPPNNHLPLKLSVNLCWGFNFGFPNFCFRLCFTLNRLSASWLLYTKGGNDEPNEDKACRNRLNASQLLYTR